MSDRECREIQTALALMRMALALLDRAGSTLAAARLQHAIDTAEAEGLSTPAPPNSETPAGAEEPRSDRWHRIVEGKEKPH